MKEGTPPKACFVNSIIQESVTLLSMIAEDIDFA